MKRNIYILFIGLVVYMTSCIDDLNVVPIDPDEETAETVFTDVESYKQVLAKIYGGLALTGQQGPAGQGDIAGIDEGFSSYLRQYYYHQELTTDEAVIAWNDQTIKDFHNHDWGANDVFIRGMYSRIYYQIVLINEFLRQSNTDKLAERGITDVETIANFRAEARFLRALSYWHALDLFGDIPFVTEEDNVGAFLPRQASREEVFEYVESELLAIEEEMIAPMSNEFARADRAAVWSLLAKLYLNAEVYNGTSRYTDCITYCNKVINAGYTLHPDFQEMFLADNNDINEFIFRVAFDGQNTQSYGGTTFIIHAAVGGDMSASAFGIDGGWAGLRTTSAFVNKFDDISGNTDSRALFFTDGQSLEIEDLSTFTDGYAVTKWKNITSSGQPGSDLTFTDTDFPIFRLADIYLMYAEAVLRGGSGGTATEALGYVNALRERAYGDTSGNITQDGLTLDFILDERARELAWECHRRTDLIRYGVFTSADYVWPWKGGIQEGRATDNKYQLFPIPASDIAANPNLEQNPGY
ncbi:RagB/SusD family nutrient uptake outer membrane protein [Mangrovivirga sp. M17]|uniref:RagB/SusD family nutrient uptake outer membrane protein n=1 Tax=Mangrovivirga halotolerans TaxID=2993936 RepID=A0ABT3RVS2_9BACT|nr:RagB/SusD family nutrient uptake outer membrane protein [Mangrovivirga halotolerans]MCX2745662.1 RagB/SusD family nutrient uptake outer membrane protein [Mangrovivirga halotolerans]